MEQSTETILEQNLKSQLAYFRIVVAKLQTMGGQRLSEIVFEVGNLLPSDERILRWLSAIVANIRCDPGSDNVGLLRFAAERPKLERWVIDICLCLRDRLLDSRVQDLGDPVLKRDKRRRRAKVPGQLETFSTEIIREFRKSI
jgi:hypothetical protein